MAVAYESDGGTVFAASASNAAITVPLPATRPVGSVLLFIGFSRLISDTVGTAPSGYTLLTGFPKSSGIASGGRIWAYARVVAGGESAPSFACTSAVTGNSGDLWGACIFCYSGVDTSGTIDQILDGAGGLQDTSSVATCTYPTLTISNADSMVVRFLARWQDLAVTFTPTATWNEREDASSIVRTGAQFHLQDKLPGASGALPTVTIAPSNTTTTRYLAVSLALKAAPTGTPWTATPADTLSLADTQAFDRGEGVADTLALADAQAFAATFERTLTDPLALTDALRLDRALNLADTLALSDLASAQAGKEALIADTLALADALRLDRALALADTLALADGLSSQAALLRTVADTLALADLADPVKQVGGVAWAQPIADTLALADTLTRQAAFVRGVADTLTLEDSLAAQAALVRSIADTLALSDLIVTALEQLVEGHAGGFEPGTERGRVSQSEDSEDLVLVLNGRSGARTLSRGFTSVQSGKIGGT